MQATARFVRNMVAGLWLAVGLASAGAMLTASSEDPCGCIDCGCVNLCCNVDPCGSVGGTCDMGQQGPNKGCGYSCYPPSEKGDYSKCSDYCKEG